MLKHDTPYLIGRFVFKNKQEAEANAKRILRLYPVGEMITECDREFLDCLINNHPDYEEKVGCGISGFTIGINREWKAQRMFVLIRNDGSSTDFSYLKCLNRKNKLTEFSGACRRVVAGDIIAFKAQAYGLASAGGTAVRCAITGQPVAAEDAHIDHVPPNTFRSIVSQFIAINSIDLDTVRYTKQTDNTYGKLLIDDHIANAFRRFHSENSILRVTTAKANLSLPKTMSK